jgi:hypothetical protein
MRVSPFRTRFRFGSAHKIGLTLLKRVTRRPVLQKVRHHTYTCRVTPPCHSALTACKQMVSGSISFPSRGAFHLSLTVLVHYRSPGYLALESGLPSFPPGSSCPAVLKNRSHTVLCISITGLSPAMAGLSRRVHLHNKVCNCAKCLLHLIIGLTTPPV